MADPNWRWPGYVFPQPQAPTPPVYGPEPLQGDMSSAVRGFQIPVPRYNWPGGLSWSWPGGATASTVVPTLPTSPIAPYGPVEQPPSHQPHPGLNEGMYNPMVIPPLPVGPPPDSGSIGETYIPDYDEAMGVPTVTPPNAPPQMGFWARLRQAATAPQNPTPPMSMQYSAGLRKPDFIYTNPVAARQASESLATRLGYETAQDQGYRAYQIARENAEQARQNQAMRILENERDRALQREGFDSAERSAANRYANDPYDARNIARQRELAQTKYIADKTNYNSAKTMAANLNSKALAPLEHAKFEADAARTGWVVKQNGVWVVALPDPDATAPGVVTIQDVLGRIQGANDAGRANLGLPVPPVAPR